MAGALRSPAVEGIDYYESPIIPNIDVMNLAGAASNTILLIVPHFSVYNIFICSSSVCDFPTYNKSLCQIPASTQTHHQGVLEQLQVRVNLTNMLSTKMSPLPHLPCMM